MKRYFLIVLAFLGVNIADAQNVSQNEKCFDAVFVACVNLRDAVATKNLEVIRMSAEELKKYDIACFNTLICDDDSVGSLNGHLVFDQDFVDSLAEGKDIYQKADAMYRDRTHRGQNPDGSILTKTCFVKAGQSTKYSFASKGHQELAVVAESGGLVTIKIRVTNRDGLNVHYDDTEDVKIGRHQRRVAFDLPEDKRNTVELEIINCGIEDCSFVVISN